MGKSGHIWQIKFHTVLYCFYLNFCSKAVTVFTVSPQLLIYSSFFKFKCGLYFWSWIILCLYLVVSNRMLIVVSGRWLTDRQTSCLSQSVWTSGGPSMKLCGALWKPSGLFFKSLQSTYTVLRSIISGGHYTSHWRAVCLLYCLDSWQARYNNCDRVRLHQDVSEIYYLCDNTSGPSLLVT